MTPNDTDVKFKAVLSDARKSSFRKYRDVYYGDTPLATVLLSELIQALVGGIPGAAGLVLRSRCYRFMFGACGRKVVFGRRVTLRHAHKIRIGDNVIVDDNVVLDAKGIDNRGITVGNNVYIGRNTIVYCKNGNILIEDRANISANCDVFSSNHLTIGAGTVIGAYSYLLSGGEYDIASHVPFAEQSGMGSAGPLRIGANCWLGARVTVLDAASVGDNAVIGAGAVVNKPLPECAVAVGVPATVIRRRSESRL